MDGSGPDQNLAGRLRTEKWQAAVPPELRRSFTGPQRCINEAPRTRGRMNTWEVGFLLTFTEPIPACTVYVYSYTYVCVYNKELFMITCVASLRPVCHSVPLHFSLRPSSLDLLLVSPAHWSSPLLWRNHTSSSHCAECLETHLEVI